MKLRELLHDPEGPFHIGLFRWMATAGVALLFLSYGLLYCTGQQFAWLTPLHNSHVSKAMQWPFGAAIAWAFGVSALGTVVFVWVGAILFVVYFGFL